MKRQFISILLGLSLVTSSCAALTVSAADADSITKKAVTTYLYSMDKQTELECLFTEELPEVPYIDPEDYMDHVFTVDAMETKNSDGTYSVTNRNGTMVIDPNADTVYYENFERLIQRDINDIGSLIEDPYSQPLPSEQKGKIFPVTIDLAPYGIDIIEYGGRVFLPVSTLNDIHTITYNYAEYVDGNLYFSHSTDFFNYDNYYNRDSVYNSLKRTPEMADFTYREMCFFIDHFYGAPSQAKIASSIEEKGFDKTLDTFNDDTRTAKRLLTSTDKKDYVVGMILLSDAFYDGGHSDFTTDFSLTPYYYGATSLADYFWELMSNPQTEEEKRAYSIFNDLNDRSYKYSNPLHEKWLALDKYNTVKTWEYGAIMLVECNDTVVFIFDSFYSEVIEPFKWSLDYAAEHNIKNFVIDLSTNGGGLSSIVNYMMAILTNKNNHTNENSFMMVDKLTGNITTDGNRLDLNLDGAFDDRDKEVVYDFNFAVLTTNSSFSCGNLMPFMCKDNGICLLGEQSGGGACALSIPVTPENHYFTLSNSFMIISESGLDVDAGAPVDYELVETKTVTDESGVQQLQKDYSKLYDFDLISSLVTEFYATKEPTTEPAPTECTAPTEIIAPAESTAPVDSTTPGSTKPATGSQTPMQTTSSSTGAVATGDGIVSAIFLLVLISSSVIFVWFKAKHEER